MKLEICLADLDKVKCMNSPYLVQLNEDLPPGSSTFKGQHVITKSNFKLEDLTTQFIDSMIDNIKSRYIQTFISR